MWNKYLTFNLVLLSSSCWLSLWNIKLVVVVLIFWCFWWWEACNNFFRAGLIHPRQMRPLGAGRQFHPGQHSEQITKEERVDFNCSNKVSSSRRDFLKKKCIYGTFLNFLEKKQWSLVKDLLCTEGPKNEVRKPARSWGLGCVGSFAPFFSHYSCLLRLHIIFLILVGSPALRW